MLRDRENQSSLFFLHTVGKLHRQCCRIHLKPESVKSRSRDISQLNHSHSSLTRPLLLLRLLIPAGATQFDTHPDNAVCLTLLGTNCTLLCLVRVGLFACVAELLLLLVCAVVSCVPVTLIIVVKKKTHTHTGSI